MRTTDVSKICWRLSANLKTLKNKEISKREVSKEASDIYSVARSRKELEANYGIDVKQHF